MRAREPDPVDAFDLVDGLQQAGEVAGRIVRRGVVIDDLAQQLHFPPSARRGLPHLGDDVGLGPHAFVAARIRYDAEAAEIVAPFDDRDVGLDRVVPPSHPQRERHIVVGIDVDDRRTAAAVCGLLDEHRQAADGLRADHHVGDPG